MAGSSAIAADALLGLLVPFWQVVIALCVVAAVLGSGWRLAARGPSRMTTALVVIGAAVVGLTVIGVLLEGL